MSCWELFLFFILSSPGCERVQMLRSHLPLQGSPLTSLPPSFQGMTRPNETLLLIDQARQAQGMSQDPLQYSLGN